MTKFLLSIGPGNGRFSINLEDEVVRGAIVLQDGNILPPAPRPAPPPVAPPTAAKVAEAAEAKALTPWQKATREVALVTGGMSSVVALGKLTGPAFMSNFFTFGLAGLIGYRVVWGVAPALHSPLMSVTNAISGEWHKLSCGRCGVDSRPQVWLVLAVYSSWVVAICPPRSLRPLVLRRSCWLV